jgi:hypothetical protein
MGPSQEEEEEEERQRHWISKREPRFPIPRGDQAVPRYDCKWDPDIARMNGAITISSTALLRV